MAIFTAEQVHALGSMFYYNGQQCPNCVDPRSWTMGRIPRCTSCGFFPMPKGEYRALAREAIAIAAEHAEGVGG